MEEGRHESGASERLNESCFCVSIDEGALHRALERESGDPQFWTEHIGVRPHLFASVPVFLSAGAVREMQETVAAIEAVSELPEYRSTVMSWAPEIAREDHGPAGALMGYDFHLGESGPRLIEVNTNAGGAFLNSVLARAQRLCCSEDRTLPDPHPVTFEEAVVGMFKDEWARQGREGLPARIAIVDDSPAEQYLYPEFILARRLLTQRGLETVIADPTELHYENGSLTHGGKQVDLVYNRLTDFTLDQPEHRVLRDGYADGGVVVTPNPHNHAVLADKRNLVVLSDSASLAGWGTGDRLRAALRAVPKTLLVTNDNADELWASRSRFFFKPFAGHGGKAVYRGEKVTRKVWEQVTSGGYVAQELVRPSERMIRIDGKPERRKVDVRLYTYSGRALLVAARIYQGQTTNFRTPGGGFAPALAV